MQNQSIKAQNSPNYYKILVIGKIHQMVMEKMGYGQFFWNKCSSLTPVIRILKKFCFKVSKRIFWKLLVKIVRDLKTHWVCVALGGYEMEWEWWWEQEPLLVTDLQQQVSLVTSIPFFSWQSCMGPLCICPPQAEARESLTLSHSHPTQRRCTNSRPHLFMYSAKSYRKKPGLCGWMISAG